MTYDLLMRLPFLGWVSLCVIGQLVAFNQMKSEPLDLIVLVHIAMRFSAIAFMLLMAVAVVLRTRPSGKASGLEPRLSALLGTFLVYGIAMLPRRDLSLSGEIASTLLTMVGTFGAIVALFRLGRSFSIMAESRQLVTTGAYHFVRHPLYLAEELAIVGVFLQFASTWAMLLLSAQIAFQLRRMHNEEVVLAAHFPEYAAYQRATARLIPGIY